MSPVTFWQKISAALFLILTIAVFLFFKFALAIDQGRKYHTFFEATVRGLAPSSLVCWDGIRVGKVTKISNDFDNKQVRIDFVLTEDDVHLFKAHEKEEGTKAFLLTNYITGLQYINLSGGKPNGDKNILEENEEVPSKNPTNWNEKISETTEGLKKIMEGVQEIFSKKNLKSISNSIKSIEGITASVDRELLASNSESLIKKTANILDKANNTLGKVDNLVGESTQKDVEKILKNVKELSDPKKLGLDKLSQKLQTQLDEIADSTKTLLAKVDRILDSKGKRPDVTSTLAQVDSLLKDNNENLKEMIGNLAKITSLMKKEMGKLLKEGNKAMIGLSYFTQKELKRTNQEVQKTLKDLSDVLKMLKSTPNALIFGSRGGRK